MVDFIEKFFSMHGNSLEFAGISGFGLERHFALELINLLRERNIAILGGDVYRIESNRIEPTYDNWYLDKEVGVDDSWYIQKSLAKAELFIRDYNDPENGTILYKLEIRGY